MMIITCCSANGEILWTLLNCRKSLEVLTSQINYSANKEHVTTYTARYNKQRMTHDDSEIFLESSFWHVHWPAREYKWWIYTYTYTDIYVCVCVCVKVCVCVGVRACSLGDPSFITGIEVINWNESNLPRTLGPSAWNWHIYITSKFRFDSMSNFPVKYSKRSKWVGEILRQIITLSHK